MTKRKRASELTTEGAMRRLFPKEVRQALKAEVRRLNREADRRKR